jgi:hypothetical protein
MVGVAVRVPDTSSQEPCEEHDYRPDERDDSGDEPENGRQEPKEIRIGGAEEGLTLHVRTS